MKYKAFHALSYGLYIVASEHENQKAGYIANTVFQVTSDPPQIAISCNRKNDSAGVILTSRKFSVSALDKDATGSLIGEFGFMASSELDKFRNITTITAVTGAPVVTDSCVAWFDCRVVDTMDAGTHVIIIGEVLDCNLLSEKEPLTYKFYREKFRMLAPKNAPTYIEKSRLEAEDKHKPGKAEKKVNDSGNLKEMICTVCGYRYNSDEGDPATGIPPGTSFDDLPGDYRCPVCNASKDYFTVV